jgi:glutathione S-transferase
MPSIELARWRTCVQLVGMLDSPYVRRVAIALVRLGVPFKHQPLSLFRHIDAFSAINPLLKAPTLVTDDGTVLSDSSVILDYVASITPGGGALWPADPARCLAAARATGLALTVCEKAVQAHYERALRPPERRHEPWVERVRRQLLAGLDALEEETPIAASSDFGVAEISVACAFAFAFTQLVTADIAPASRTPRLATYCAGLEERPEFRAVPAEDGVKAPVALAR